MAETHKLSNVKIYDGASEVQNLDRIPYGIQLTIRGDFEGASHFYFSYHLDFTTTAIPTEEYQQNAVNGNGTTFSIAFTLPAQAKPVRLRVKTRLVPNNADEEVLQVP